MMPPEALSGNFPVRYSDLFWLFIIFSLFGVLLEGCWERFRYGRWETHVVTIWGPFCIIYGMGAVGCYIGSLIMEGQSLLARFLTFGIIGSAVELLCGLFLERKLHMRAWDYSDHFMNIGGHISLKMTMAWGFLGVLFGHMVPDLSHMLSSMTGGAWDIACALFSVFMAIDLAVTASCLIRWKERHEGVAPSTKKDYILDECFPDELLENRFIEWSFIDSEPEKSFA